LKSEKEKMLTGEMYDASDPVLLKERQKARGLTHKLNYTEYGSKFAYQKILNTLLPNSATDIDIEPPFFCDYGYNIYAETKVFFNFNCVLLDVMPIKIGSNVLFGPNVQIYTATHPMDAEKRREGIESASPVIIGDDCWIGGSAIIMPGITIGERCVIGSGAVVTKDIPSDVVVVGNPAKQIPTDGAY
jgi:maltose O-acetyltransferase